MRSRIGRMVSREDKSSPSRWPISPGHRRRGPRGGPSCPSRGSAERDTMRAMGRHTTGRGFAGMNRACDALTWLPSESGGGPAFYGRVERFRIGEVEFRCSFERGSEPNRFYIRKPRRLVEGYLAVFDRFPEANVVELGIMEGGSVALA